MKYARGKRIWSMILVICLMLSMIPAFVSHVEVEAEAVSGVSSLTCSGFISNSLHRSYIDTMMKYYINTYSKLQTALNSGLSVVFMFEGGSDYYDTYEYVDGIYQTRLQAVCIVVQLNSSGNAEIVFYSESCSSIPDDANWCTGAAYSGSTTILDGIYAMYTCNHNGNYAAFTTDCYTGWYCPYAGSTGFSNGCSGINIHTRGSNYCGGQSAGYCQSAGCQLIGYGASSDNSFNQFMKTVAGISFNAYDGSYGTFSSTGTYKGYYVVDRQLGLMTSDGTEYGSGSLAELYTTGDLDGITAFSTAARNDAGFSIDYKDQCTRYASYCKLNVIADEVEVRGAPCSAGTDATSTLIEYCNTGDALTAVGLYKNLYGNYWYEVLTSSGELGYVYSGDVEYVDDILSDIVLTNATPPNGHVVGSTFYVNGTIKSSYNELSAVSCYIHSGFGTDGDIVTGASDTPSGNSYTLEYSNVDNATWMGALELGNYTYAISASYVNYYATDPKTLQSNTGTLTLMDEYFAVISSSVSQSSCSHTNSTYVISAPTCTTNGSSVTVCSTCGLISESVTSGGHSYGSWSVTSQPTCTAAGAQSRTCPSCGDVQTQSIAATGHSYTSKTYAATCQQYERVEYTCVSCGDNYSVFADELMSQWLTTKPEGVDESLIETKTQYRYSDYETTTSYSDTLSGYTLKSTDWEKSGSSTVNYVSSWPSGFDTGNSLYTQYNKSKVSASETTTSRITVDSDELCGYLFYHWCYGTYTEGPINRSTSQTQTDTFNTFHAFYADKSAGDPSSMTTASDSSVVNGNADCCTDSHWYYYVPVYAQTYTTYKALFTYERWTDYSEWSDTAVTASSTRKVETRTVYRYSNATLADHSWGSGVVTTPATCNTAGVRTYTCSVCTTTKTEVIPATHHDYIAAVTAPTCTQAGFTTYTCSKCDDSYLSDYIDATGHSYVGGKCSVCGAADPNAEPFSLIGSNMVLGNDLDMNFFFTQTDISGTDYYVVITHYDLEEGEKTYTIQYADWGTYGPYYMVTLDGLAARQMADTIEVVVYNGDGSRASKVWTDSIRAYALRSFASSTQTDEGRTLLVDMLNYGAAAQEFFGYNTGDLANSTLTTAQKAYATSSVSVSDQRTKGTNYVGSSLVLKSRIMLTVLFDNLTTDMYAIVSYTDHTGEVITTRVNGSDFVSYSGYYGVMVDDLVVADGAQMVSVMVYSANGALAGWATDSMDSYAARSMGTNSIYEMVAKFTASAYAYFH